MDPNIEALAGSVKDILHGRLDQFLNSNSSRKEFLEERTRRLAELTVQLAKATTADERDLIASSMDVVKDAITNELYGAAVVVSSEFKSAAHEVLGTVVDWGLKIAPALLRALADRKG